MYTKYGMSNIDRNYTALIAFTLRKFAEKQQIFKQLIEDMSIRNKKIKNRIIVNMKKMSNYQSQNTLVNKTQSVHFTSQKNTYENKITKEIISLNLQQLNIQQDIDQIKEEGNVEQLKEQFQMQYQKEKKEQELIMRKNKQYSISLKQINNKESYNRNNKKIFCKNRQFHNQKNNFKIKKSMFSKLTLFPMDSELLHKDYHLPLLVKKKFMQKKLKKCKLNHCSSLENYTKNHSIFSKKFQKSMMINIVKL